MDLIIRQARVRNLPLCQDIAVDGGKIVAVKERVEETGQREIDAGGRLVIPAFIDPHIHLDKTMITDVVRPNISGTLTEAIEIIWEKKKNYSIQDIVERAGRVVEMAVTNGTLKMRSHADVDTIGGLTPLRGVMAVKEKYAHLVDLQVVAFPQEGILKDPGCEQLMWEAAAAGADVVGGMPANEHTPDDSRRHISICFDIAEKYDLDVDMHVDETDDPSYRTLEMLADETMKRGWHGRVTAGHTCALAAYDDHYADYVIGKVKAAGIHMITNPATNLMLQGRLDRQPKRRGITRVKELLATGINVAFGQDCIKDTFYPFGRADMLEVGLISAHAAHMSLPHEIETVFAMPLEHSARILRLENYGLEAGKDADLVILDAFDAAGALRLQADRLYVIRRGRVVAETRREIRRNW